MKIIWTYFLRMVELYSNHSTLYSFHQAYSGTVAVTKDDWVIWGVLRPKFKISNEKNNATKNDISRIKTT